MTPKQNKKQATATTSPHWQQNKIKKSHTQKKTTGKTIMKQKKNTLKQNKTKQYKPPKKQSIFPLPPPLPLKKGQRTTPTTKTIGALELLGDYRGYPELFHFVFQPSKKIYLERKPHTVVQPEWQSKWEIVSKKHRNIDF